MQNLNNKRILYIVLFLVSVNSVFATDFGGNCNQTASLMINNTDTVNHNFEWDFVNLTSLPVACQVDPNSSIFFTYNGTGTDVEITSQLITNTSDSAYFHIYHNSTAGTTNNNFVVYCGCVGLTKGYESGSEGQPTISTPMYYQHWGFENYTVDTFPGDADGAGTWADLDEPICVTDVDDAVAWKGSQSLKMVSDGLNHARFKLYMGEETANVFWGAAFQHTGNNHLYTGHNAKNSACATTIEETDFDYNSQDIIEQQPSAGVSYSPAMYYNDDWFTVKWYFANTLYNVNVNGSSQSADRVTSNNVNYGCSYIKAEYEMQIDEIYISTNNFSMYSTPSTVILGSYENPVSTSIPLPTVSITYPTDGDNLDNSTAYPIYVSGTAVVTGYVASKTWINDTRFQNIGNNTNFNFTINGSIPYDIGIHLAVIANNSDGIARNDTIYFTFDVTSPDIVANFDNTTFLNFQNIWSIQINFTDDVQVYSYNVSTTNGTVSNRSGLDTKKYIYNGTLNVSRFDKGIGSYNLTVWSCDAHTKNHIDEWEYSKDVAEKKLTYNFDDGSWFSVKVSDKETIDDFYTTKLDDRYTFSYIKNPSDKKDKFTFIVKSSHYIEIIGNEKGYLGWLIIEGMQKWIDFNLPAMTKDKYKIKRISGNEVEVDIEGIVNDVFSFNSAGEMNCRYKDFKFNVFNYTVSYPANVLETSAEEFGLIVNFNEIYLAGSGMIKYKDIFYSTSNTSSFSQINFSVNVTIPEISSTTSNGSFYWNFTLNDTEFFSLNYSNLIQRIQLLSCGATSNVPALNLSFKNENIPTQYLQGDFDAVFVVWTNNSGNTVNFTFNANSKTNYSICIYPNTSIYTDAYFVYNVTNGFNQRWYLTSARLSSNTSVLYLYNFPTTNDISEMRGTLRDTSYDYYPSVTTKLQRYYVDTDTWRTVQMDRSDNFGQILFNIKEIGTDYKLLFQSGQTQIDSTNSMKFICNSGVCTLTFIVENEPVDVSHDVSYAYSYNNASQMFQLNYSDSSGLTQQINLVVSQVEGDDSTTICDITQASSTGTMNCNTTGYYGTLLVRVYKTQSPTIADLMTWIRKVESNVLFKKLQDAALTEEGGFWAVGISTIFVAGGAVVGGPIGAIASLIISVFFISLLQLMNYFTLAFLMAVATVGVIVSFIIRK